jgi:hypothetical protein
MRIRKNRRIFWSVGVVLAAFLGWTFYTPIPFSYLKIAALGSLLLLVLGVSFGFRYGRWFGVGTTLCLLICALWPAPARASDPGKLRTRFCAALTSYLGTPYVWGGENGRGIDCSGLMRRAMIDALLSTGWQERNPALWREAAFVWWYDCSAREMKNGYSGRIQIVFTAKSLNTVNLGELYPGDMAVLQSGVHVLAFLGNQAWIQADPNLVNGGDKVIETQAPSRNGWFEQRIAICRWEIFD